MTKPIPTFTTIVYGLDMNTPVRRVEAIQKAFGLTHIIPDWNGMVDTMEKGALRLTSDQPAMTREAMEAAVGEKGALRLTSDQPAMTREAMEAAVGYNLRVIPATTAKEMVLVDMEAKNAPARERVKAKIEDLMQTWTFNND